MRKEVKFTEEHLYNFESFYKEIIKPLILKGLFVVPRTKIVDGEDDLNFWKARAELFNQAILCIDAWIYDPRRVNLEVEWFKQFVEGLENEDKEQSSQNGKSE